MVAESCHGAFDARHSFAASGAPDGECAALAVSIDLKVLSVPFRKGFRVLEGADETKDHAADVAGFAVRVLLRVESIGIAVGADPTGICFIVFVGSAEFAQQKTVGVYLEFDRVVRRVAGYALFADAISESPDSDREFPAFFSGFGD